MKKRVLVLLTIFVLVFANVQAFGATKESLLELAKQTEINGRTEPIPDKYTKVYADFLNTDDFTPEELSFMESEYYAVLGMWQNSGVANYQDMSQSLKNQMMDRATSAASQVGASLSFNGSTVNVVSRTGRIFTVAVGSTGGVSLVGDTGSSASNAGTSSVKVIKATGLGMDFTAMYAVLCVFAGSVLVSVAVSKKYLLD